MKKIIWFCALAALVAGCRNSAIIYSERPDEITLDKIGGRYILTEVKVEGQKSGAALSDWLAAESPKAVMFRPDVAQESKPVTVWVSAHEVQGSPLYRCAVFFNNLLSCCTLNIWPAFGRSQEEIQVRVCGQGTTETKTFTLEQRTLTSWFVLGLIPVPACADERNVDFSDKRDNLIAKETLSLFTDDFYKKLPQQTFGGK